MALFGMGIFNWFDDPLMHLISPDFDELLNFLFLDRIINFSFSEGFSIAI